MATLNTDEPECLRGMAAYVKADCGKYKWDSDNEYNAVLKICDECDLLADRPLSDERRTCAVEMLREAVIKMYTLQNIG